MLRVSSTALLLLLAACSGGPTPSPDASPPPEYRIGCLPHATLTGRVVDAEGRGIEGVEVWVQPFDDGFGLLEPHFQLGQSRRDGTWSCSAPSHVILYLTFRREGYAPLRKQTMWLREGRTYDLGNQVFSPTHRFTFRIVDPSGRILTHFYSPDLQLDAEGWASLWVDDRTRLLRDAPFRFLADFQGAESEIEENDGEPIEIVTRPLHSILRVTYPDGTPVADATVSILEQLESTNRAGELPLFEEEVEDSPFWIEKGDFSVEIEGGEGPGKPVTHVMPRGGDLDIELTCVEGTAPALGWMLLRGLDADGDFEDAFSFIGRARGRLENLALGEHRFLPEMIFGSAFEAPESQVVVVKSGEVVEHEIPVRVRPAKVFPLLVTTTAGKAAAGATLRCNSQIRTTDAKGRATVVDHPQEDDPGLPYLQIEHPEWGTFDGRPELSPEGHLIAPLAPWAHLTFRAVNASGEISNVTELRLATDSLTIHARYFEGERPWWLSPVEGSGKLEVHLRAYDYLLRARSRGWERTESVRMEVGEKKSVTWTLPVLREFSVRVHSRGKPVTGVVELESPVPQGWRQGPATKLDENGRATLYTPAMDVDTPLKMRFRSPAWGLVTETCVTAVDGEIELELSPHRSR